MISKHTTRQLALAAGFLASTFVPGLTFAQGSDSQAMQTQSQSQTAPVTPAQKEGRRHGVMKGLNLTDDQKAQFKKIHEATKSQVEAVKSDTTLSADQQQAKIHGIRHDARMQMVKLLTPDQRQRMRSNIRELRAARREKQQQTPQAQPQG